LSILRVVSLLFLARTHRERQVAYTSSLEAEVVQLRAKEARIIQETKSLYAELNLLKRVLAQNGIPVPGQERRLEEKELGLDKVFTLSVGKDEKKKKNRGKQIYIQQRPEDVMCKFGCYIDLLMTY
jgi:hypothetical protein